MEALWRHDAVFCRILTSRGRNSLQPVRIHILHDESDSVIHFLDSSLKYLIVSSTVSSSLNEVEGEPPLAAHQKSVFESGARGLGHPAFSTLRTLWEMREHVVISSLFFGNIR